MKGTWRTLAVMAALAWPALALSATPPPGAVVNPLPYPGQYTDPNTTQGALAPLDTPLSPKTQQQFVNQLPIPVDLTPDKTKYPGWDYYEIQAAPVTPVAYWVAPGTTAPAGTEWLGLRDPVTAAPLYTPVWGYGQIGAGPLGRDVVTYPSMGIRATKGTPVKVKWVNNLPDQHLFCPQPLNANWPCAIDRTLMGTKLTGSMLGAPGGGQYGGPQQPDNAMVVHLHGGEIPPEADGFAELWFGNPTTAALYSPTALPIDPPLSIAATGTPLTMTRPTGNSMIYNYPMVQEAGMIWFHDHALGKTRINVVAGPAGFFQINDANEPTTLPSGKYEINVAFQDRAFNLPQPTAPNIATINYPNGMNQAIAAPLVPQQTPLTPGGNATVHPQWVPEYFGDTPIINGMAWPVLNVEPRKYRFHFLDGSNARCWALQRSDGKTFTQIGKDGSYLPAPVAVTKLLMCSGERHDVIMDFTALAVGTKVYLTNNAPAPFPKGALPSNNDVGKPLMFKVVPLTAPDTSVIPTSFASAIPAIRNQPAVVTRELVLNEVLDAVTLYPLRVQIDGKPFEGAITETPKKGTIEIWKIINTTGDLHPIHTHLVQHQVISRQVFDTAGYSAATGFAVPGNTTFTKLPITPYLKSAPRGPDINEQGYADTTKSWPGEVLTIIAKWDGRWDTTVSDPASAAVPQAPAFLAVTSGPYVWHCHIVDHEDNEMMRPVVVQP
ncbi:spore coat protein [Anaeromyxobacter oryzae]|uniref:Spore coat protein n=2 Tax=Anaeromyxobacter oryzae TaxID=2918170 RepID=A0ABM7WNH4_9BACT|nr:spore coat protein [Anaeromyxobacter oryzae]